MEVDSTDGCVAIDGKTSCEDVVLEFGEGDSYTVAAIPHPGYAFSHWKKGRKYLFGDNTEQVLTLDVSGIDDIPENTYYMEPVFTPLCETDFSGNYSEDYAYLNCNGDRMSTSHSFADILGSKRIYHVSVLFYVDTNRPELGRLTPDEFVREQVEAQNRALTESGVHLQFTVAGVIPITVPFTGESVVNTTLDNMVESKGVFSRIAQDREHYEADLVHTIVKFANGSNSCGAAYISAIDLPDRYHAGVTSCFAFEGGDLR